MSHAIWSKPGRGVTGGHRLEQERSEIVGGAAPGAGSNGEVARKQGNGEMTRFDTADDGFTDRSGIAFS